MEMLVPIHLNNHIPICKQGGIIISYTIKRCPICNQIINVHKRGTRFTLKNCCEHIDPSIDYTYQKLKDAFRKEDSNERVRK